ncbi:hypothetical protein LAG90_17325 [Marinilongibacter aquaticus]|uniref:hypothetical protein n=1 Tax=Marinilongibacter aquaticus TaxID=2975157 RepID=UPI0021BDCA09|nr:hypothetical protein [Marinilongibacter aquaticus]UBM58567.1 hypothetical protein LAG90_17325 [Marinilongibacter aquaticus]
MLRALKKWILPEQIDFFQCLVEQSLQTGGIIDEVLQLYLGEGQAQTNEIFARISEAKESRELHLKKLESVFITSVDKEAISRAFDQLYWIALSIEHLVIEIDTYRIQSLMDYKALLELLKQEMTALTAGFQALQKLEKSEAGQAVYQVIHINNLLVKEYAKALNTLFESAVTRHMLTNREILSQLKEISKRMHVCANQIEDILFKMN